jgi:hypothetical protein
MKHLKKFNESKNLNFTELPKYKSPDYYDSNPDLEETKIYNDKVQAFHKSESFTDRQIKIIKELFPTARVHISSGVPYMPSGIKFIDIVDKGMSAQAYRTDDEWYYVTSFHERPSVTYKCDQFEGLIECLKHIKNHTINKRLEKLVGRDHKIGHREWGETLTGGISGIEE